MMSPEDWLVYDQLVSEANHRHTLIEQANLNVVRFTEKMRSTKDETVKKECLAVLDVSAQTILFAERELAEIRSKLSKYH